jgi:hypothetical protein
VPFLEPVTLEGDLVTVEPLRADHHDELVAAASDGRLWEHWYTSVPSRRLLTARGSRPSRVPFPACPTPLTCR